MALVDTVAEQAVLERLVEASKPPVPRDVARLGLHWLLFTPFRYPPPPGGSRFRGPNDPGVFYGAEQPRTACAEVGYWRWRHLRDSPGLKAMPARPQTVFRVPVSGSAIDLREPPFVPQGQEGTVPGTVPCRAGRTGPTTAIASRSPAPRARLACSWSVMNQCAIRATAAAVPCSTPPRSRAVSRWNSRDGS